MSVSFAARLGSRGFDLALDVAEGETVAVLGPNGAGKSTLLAVLAGLVRPDSGHATIGDQTLFDLPAASTRGRAGRWLAPYRREVALLAQEALLFPHLSVRANVAFGPRSRGAGRAEAGRRADRWLAETESTDLADRKPEQLSGGQAQRVAIARALAAEPRLLLLDEPLSALDVAVAPTIRRTLRRVIADRTTIIVTHDVLDAYLLADRVVVMNAGHIVEEGPTRDVLEHPRAEFTAELAGVTLVTGARTASGLVTDAGLEIAASPAGDGAAIAVGTRVAAALRPSSLRVDLPGHVADADAGERMNRVAATVRDLEPHGDLVRVRTDWLTTDVAPSRVADLDLAPGVTVALSFSADDVSIYPA